MMEEKKLTLNIENKKIKMGLTLMHDNPNELLAQVEKIQLEKEVTDVIYSITTIPLQQQMGTNTHVTFKCIVSALVWYMGTQAELKQINFGKTLLVQP